MPSKKTTNAAPIIEYNISRFDPYRIEPGRPIGVLGKSGSGKSVVTCELLHIIAKKSHTGLVFSATEFANGTYSKFVPGCLIFNEFREDKIFELFNIQARKRKAREGLEADIATMKRLNRPVEVTRLEAQLREREALDRAFVVIDDMAFSQSTFNNDAMKALMFQGRHFSCTTIVTVQYSLLLNTALRANLAYVFVARESIIANRRRLYEHFFGVFPSFDDFERVFAACTTGYDFICLDNTSRSMNPNQCVHWHRANPNLPPFRLCSDAWWRFNSRNFDPNHEEKNRQKKLQEIKGAKVVRKKK